jgi:tetratricopeptide (TPR) repeat protein
MRVSTAHLPSADALQTACLEISQWAQEAGFGATAVAFAEACAAVVRDDEIWSARARRDSRTLVAAAWGAFVAARTNRIAGEEWRAEVFYSRAIRFAAWAGVAGRESPDRKRAWSIYVRAHLGWGRLHSKHTRFRAAGRHYRAAARRAFIEGEEWLSAQTCHDMLALAIEEGLMASIGRQTVPDFDQARRRGRMALARYPRHHERFPAAVHDYVFTLVCEHRYATAMPILELLMRAPIPQHDQVIGWGTLARTAGALGDPERYADAEAHVLRLAPHYELHAAAAFVNLAFGARGLGDWTLAEQYVQRALSLAQPAGMRLVLTIGNALLREIHARDPGPPPAPPPAGKEADRLVVLAEALGDQLAGWRGPTWTKKESQFGPATLGAV